MRNIYVVGGDTGYTNWMEPDSIVQRMEDANLVVFTGGEDVSPSFYGEPKNPTTQCNEFRDKIERLEFEQARKLRLPMIGICRGSQFLCVMAGGKLVQNQANPSYIHPIELINGSQILVTSTHHQAQYPWNLQPEEYSVIGWTTGMSPYHEDGDSYEMVNGIIDKGIEVEICYYPFIHALGIQSHPEMVYSQRGGSPEVMEYISFCRTLLNELIKANPIT